MSNITNAIHDVLMSMNDKNGHGIIRNAKMAIQISEIIISNGNYDGDWKEQLPLSAEKTDGCWKVVGSFNKELKLVGPGPWEVTIQSKDMKILSMGQTVNYDPIMAELK